MAASLAPADDICDVEGTGVICPARGGGTAVLKIKHGPFDVI